MHLKYAKMLAIVANENMELGDNTLNKWEALTCKHKISDKIFANYSPYYHIKLASHSSIGKNEDKVGNNKNRHKKVARKKDGKNLQKNPSSPNFGLRACAN